MKKSIKDYSDKLIEITDKLHYYYNVLKEKELNFEKDDYEYNFALSKIEALSLEEKEIYSKIKNSSSSEDDVNNVISRVIMKLDISLENANVLKDKRNVLFGNDLPDDMLIFMRISSKINEILASSVIEQEMDDEDEDIKENAYDLYNTFIPRIDKRFLDIVDSHIEEASDYEDIRREYVSVKYDYSFVFPLESEKEYDEIAEDNKTSFSFYACDEIFDYAKRICALNKRTITSEDNRRRIMLEADYIRALHLEVSDDFMSQLFFASKLSSLISDEEISKSYGTTVFNNILNFKEEDLELFNNDGFQRKRKF